MPRRSLNVEPCRRHDVHLWSKCHSPSYLLFSLLLECGSLGNMEEYDLSMVATWSNFFVGGCVAGSLRLGPSFSKYTASTL